MKATFFSMLGMAAFFLLGSATYPHEAVVELSCVRRHNASNTCHYNFVIQGANYRYIDVGCKGKREVILKKVQEGKLGLTKEWKVVCGEAKKPS